LTEGKEYYICTCGQTSENPSRKDTTGKHIWMTEISFSPISLKIQSQSTKKYKS